MQEKMLDLIEQIEFHPPRNRQFLLDWMDNINVIGQYHDDDGTTLFNLVQRKRGLHHRSTMEPMYSHGRIPEGSSATTGYQEDVGSF